MYIIIYLFSRELAYQIADQFRVFGSHIGLRDVVVVGGTGVYLPTTTVCTVRAYVAVAGRKRTYSVLSELVVSERLNLVRLF